MPAAELAADTGKPLIPCSHEAVAVAGRATLLFADLHGYEVLAERLPPLQVAGLLATFFDVVYDGVAEQGGEIVTAEAATVLAGFGIRDARHTQIREAVAAARSIQNHFAAYRLAWQTTYDVDTAVGIGLHRGDVASSVCDVAMTRRHALVGDAANLAVRLGRRARAGEIVLSDAVALPYRTCAAAVNTAAANAACAVLPLVELPPLDLPRGREPLTLWCIPAAVRLVMRGGRQERRA